MLRKLLKYELKATGRTFFPIYIAILLVSVVNRLIRLTDSKLASNLTSMALAGLFGALGVLTIVVLIQRFKKNLLSDEGYLMFTLPVSSTKLIWSKLIATVVWTFFSGIIAMLSGLILLAGPVTFAEIQKAFAELMILLKENIASEQIWMGIQSIIISFIGYIGFILTIYFSLSTAQLPKFNKHRGMIAFVTFFIIFIAIQWAVAIFGRNFYMTYIQSENLMLTVILAIGIILDGMLFFGTDFILRKHLNLE